jgi:cephalosporin-C deacetylase-like acetyl esterase
MNNAMFYSVIVLTMVTLVSCGGFFTASAPMPTAILTSTVYPAPPTETPMPSTPTPLPDFSELIHMFDYDKTAPLNVDWQAEEQQGAAVIHRLYYVSVDECKVYALLVAPPGNGPYPAVIYMHMGQGNKEQYLEEAKQLAGHGVVSLLLSSPFVRGCGGSQPRIGYIRTVIDIRRGVDLLESIPEVDPVNIGYVGHSFGATWGGVLAGVEPRIKTYVLMAGYAQVSRNDSLEVPDLDAILYIGHAKVASFLFQFSTNDNYISEDEALQYYNAAKELKKILWYDSTHAGLQEAGQADRLNWLSEQLGFDYP